MKQPEKIVINGRVVDWEDWDWETVHISEHEADEYENNGWTVIELQGKLSATRQLDFADGTIEVQPQTDDQGRYAAAGGHSNYGYSGYYRAYIYENGNRRVLKDFWKLFPNTEHHYQAQFEKGEVLSRIKTAIEGLTGTDAVKIKRGYAIFPETP